jgi:hypothetical protein
MKAAIATSAAPARAASRCLGAVLCLALAAPAVRAAEPAPPGTTLELGLEERIRSENLDNATDFDASAADARHHWRFRTRGWAKLGLGENTGFAIGLNNESRKTTTPPVALTLDETVIETLYLEHRFAHGIWARAGRQNLSRGDGFILMDGGPLEGSRTAYFNAVDLAWTRGPRKLDLLLVSDPDRDQYLPPIHDQHRALIEWDERAIGLYGTDASLDRTTFDAYWFFKTETDDTRPPSSAARQGDRRFHTVGGRLTRDLASDWSFVLEVAGQWGTHADGDVRAGAGQALARRAFPRLAGRPSLTLGWVALSGDDPGTVAQEGWDPPFSRYPKWSEMYIYTLGGERGPAYWTNLSMGLAELRMTPAKAVETRLSYQRLDAFHSFPGRPAVYANGTHRGDLFVARADLGLGEHWRGHALGEWFEPDDFYTGSEAGWFFRVEVMCSFGHTFGR